MQLGPTLPYQEPFLLHCRRNSTTATVHYQQGCQDLDYVSAPFRTDVVLVDIHLLYISRPYQVAQNKSAWRAQTCFTST